MDDAVTLCMMLSISTHTMAPFLSPPLIQKRPTVLDTYMVLHSVCALGVFGGHDPRANDLDRAEPSTVATRHLRVELVNGASESQVTILAVHVVGAGAGVIFEPDGVILDDAGVAFNKLVDVQNLARGLLHFVHLVQKVPEAGLGHYFVWRKDLHPKHRGVGVSLSGHVPSHYLVLTEPRLLGRGRERLKFGGNRARVGMQRNIKGERCSEHGNRGRGHAQGHEMTFRRADDAVDGRSEGARLGRSIRNTHTSP